MLPESILRILPNRFRGIFKDLGIDGRSLREIRFRIHQKVEIQADTRYILDGENVDKSDLKEMMEYISGYSMYAFEEEISQGFLTIPGGHRIGMAGQVVMQDGRVKNMRNISFINIRLSHEIIGCAEKVISYIRDGKRMYHTLIISPPGCGKTTLLRDLVRLISGEEKSDEGKSVTVVDERSEIAGCFRGIPQNDLGCRTDVLDGCPKSKGMMMAVRSLAPEVIVVDEIGGKEDVEALRYTMNCGCTMLATVHGSSYEEIMEKPELGQMVREGNFERYVVLRNLGRPGVVYDICDAKGRSLI